MYLTPLPLFTTPPLGPEISQFLFQFTSYLISQFIKSILEYFDDLLSPFYIFVILHLSFNLTFEFKRLGIYRDIITNNIKTWICFTFCELKQIGFGFK